MTKKWTDPVKKHPPKESTLNIKGDFGQFTETMKKIVHAPIKTPKTSSSSHVPDVS